MLFYLHSCLYNKKNSNDYNHYLKLLTLCVCIFLNYFFYVVNILADYKKKKKINLVVINIFIKLILQVYMHNIYLTPSSINSTVCS